jgi:hypothetical protein
MLLRGKYVGPYTGLLEDGQATEVLTTGLEWFKTPGSMTLFATADREHFQLVLGAIARDFCGSL